LKQRKIAKASFPTTTSLRDSDWLCKDIWTHHSSDNHHQKQPE
jgi:hypothetical protein